MSVNIGVRQGGGKEEKVVVIKKTGSPVISRESKIEAE